MKRKSSRGFMTKQYRNYTILLHVLNKRDGSFEGGYTIRHNTAYATGVTKTADGTYDNEQDAFSAAHKAAIYLIDARQNL